MPNWLKLMGLVVYSIQLAVSNSYPVTYAQITYDRIIKLRSMTIVEIDRNPENFPLLSMMFFHGIAHHGTSNRADRGGSRSTVTMAYLIADYAANHRAYGGTAAGRVRASLHNIDITDTTDIRTFMVDQATPLVVIAVASRIIAVTRRCATSAKRDNSEQTKEDNFIHISSSSDDLYGRRLRF